MKTRASLVILLMLGACVVALPACANRLAFATVTKFAIDISQRADQTAEVTIGYDRGELVVIPAQIGDATNDTDTYAVLGTFQVTNGNPFTGGALVIHQFFATGRTAVEAAKQPEFQRLFGAEAVDILLQGQRETKAAR